MTHFQHPNFQLMVFLNLFRLDRNRNVTDIMIFGQDDIPGKFLQKNVFPVDIEGLFIELNFRKSNGLLLGTYHPTIFSLFYCLHTGFICTLVQLLVEYSSYSNKRRIQRCGAYYSRGGANFNVDTQRRGAYLRPSAYQRKYGILPKCLYCSRPSKKERKNFCKNPNPSFVTDNKLFWETSKPFFSNQNNQCTNIKLAEGDSISNNNEKISKELKNLPKILSLIQIYKKTHLSKVKTS